MSLIQVVGFDPSMNNWGIAKGTFDPQTKAIQIHDLGTVSPDLPTGKQVRQNSKELESARQLTKAAVAALQSAQATFVEVPVGSQSARAAVSYGLCCGVLGALREGGFPFFEVTANEVKIIATGKRTATKREMIAWASTMHPDAPWPRYKKNGVVLISEGTAEHMADAVAAIYAGVTSNAFLQTLPFMRAA